MSHCLEEPQFHSFNVQYMGSAIIPHTSTGLKTLQKPLKDLYCAYQRPTGPPRLGENLLTITDAGVIVSRLMVGEVGDYATGAEVNHDLSSIQFWDAVQFVTVREKEKKYRFAFEPLNNDHSRNKDNLFSVLDFKHEKHLTIVREHPILFVLTLHRKSGLKVLDLHVFICTSDLQAIHLIEHLNVVSAKCTNEVQRRSVAFKKNPFGKKINVIPIPQNVSMNTNGVLKENTGKQKKKKWGFFRKSNMSRSVSAPDLEDSELSFAQSRQQRYDLMKGDFVHTRKSRDTLWNQGSSGEQNLSGNPERLNFQKNIDVNQSAYTLHHSEMDLSPQRTPTEEPFYQNGEQNSAYGQPQSPHRFAGNPGTAKVIPQVAQKPTPSTEQFISRPSLGVGKTYRVYENTSRDANKQVHNIVGEKFRIFGETSHSFATQKIERDYEQNCEKETKIMSSKNLNENTKKAKIPNILAYVNPESSGKDLRREHGRSLSVDRITSDSVPSLNSISDPQSPHVAVNNLRIGGVNSSPSYRRKFPTPKIADKKDQLLPSPISRNNKQFGLISDAQNVAQITSKTTPARAERDSSVTRTPVSSPQRTERDSSVTRTLVSSPQCTERDSSITRIPVSLESIHLENTRENGVPKKKKVPTATLR